MRRIEIRVTEKLRYTRSVLVDVAEGFTDTDLEKLLDKAERHSGTVDDVTIILTDDPRVKLAERPDNDYDSPDYTEVEIDEYDVKR